MIYEGFCVNNNDINIRRDELFKWFEFRKTLLYWSKESSECN